MTTRIALTNLGKYNEGTLTFTWLELPATEEEIQAAKNEIGIDGKQYEEWFITDQETDIKGLEIGEYDSLDDLNGRVTEYDALDATDQRKIAAYIESEHASLKDAMEQKDSLELLEDVKNDYDLGYYYAVESGCYTIDEKNPLSKYIDYEAFGRDIRLDESGAYVSYGYIKN